MATWLENMALSFVVFTFVHVVVASVFMVQRRRTMPIRGHSIPLVVMMSVSNAMTTLHTGLENLDLDGDCWQRLTLGLGFGLLGQVLFFARGIRIYLFYQKSKRQLNDVGLLRLMEQNNNDDDSSTTSSQLSTSKEENSHGIARMRRYIKDRYIITAAFGFFAFIIAIEVVTMIVSGDIDGSCPDLPVTTNLHLGITAIFATLVFVTLHHLKRVSDAYTIKRELFANAIFTFVGIITGLVASITLDPVSLLVFYVNANLMIFNSLTWKVLTSYGIHIFTGLRRFGAESSRSARLRSEITLCDLLLHPGGMAAFEEHLKRKWCAENMAFFKAARLYKFYCEQGNFPSNSHRARAAVYVYHVYISVEGQSQVNLKSQRYEAIKDCLSPFLSVIGSNTDSRISHSQMDEVPADLFDDAALEIFNLMERDSLTSFKLCNSYANILNKIMPKGNEHGFSKVGEIMGLPVAYLCSLPSICEDVDDFKKVVDIPQQDVNKTNDDRNFGMNLVNPKSAAGCELTAVEESLIKSNEESEAYLQVVAEDSSKKASETPQADIEMGLCATISVSHRSDTSSSDETSV